MKKLFFTLIILILLVVSLYFALNLYFLKPAVEKAVAHTTGLTLNLDSIELNLFNNYLDVNGITLGNPSGFKGETMIKSPEVYIDYDLNSLFKGDIHLGFARINVSEFYVEKDQNGDLNINVLTKKSENKEKKIYKPREILVDSLKLKIDKVIYADYSVGSIPMVKEYDIKLDNTYKDIRGIKPLINLIAYKVMVDSGISALAGVDPSTYKSELSESLQKQAEKVEENIQKQILMKPDNDTLDNDSADNDSMPNQIKENIGNQVPITPEKQN